MRITPTGRETVARFDEFREAKMAALRQLVSMLDPDDRELFGKLLRRIVALPPLLASEAPAVSVGASADAEGAAPEELG